MLNLIIQRELFKLFDTFNFHYAKFILVMEKSFSSAQSFKKSYLYKSILHCILLYDVNTIENIKIDIIIMAQTCPSFNTI